MGNSKVIDYISKLEHPDNYPKLLSHVRIPVYLKEGTVPACRMGLDTRHMQYAEIKECPICLHRYRPTKIVERFEGIHEFRFNCINCNVLTIIQFIDPPPKPTPVEWNPVGVVTDWKIDSTKIPEYEMFREYGTRRNYFPKLGKPGEIAVNYKLLNDDFLKDPFGTTKKLDDDNNVMEYSVSVGPDKKVDLNNVKLRDAYLPISELGRPKFTGPLNLDAFNSFEDKTAAFFELAKSNILTKDELITMAKQWGLIKDKHEIKRESYYRLLKGDMIAKSKVYENQISDGMKMFDTFKGFGYIPDKLPNWINDYFVMQGKDLNAQLPTSYDIPNQDKCTFELSKASCGTDARQKMKDDIFDAMTLGIEPLEIITSLNDYQERLNQHMKNMLDLVLRGKSNHKLDLIIIHFLKPLNNKERILTIEELLKPYVSTPHIPIQHLNIAYKQIKPYVDRYIAKTTDNSKLRNKKVKRAITDAFLRYLYERFILHKDLLKE